MRIKKNWGKLLLILAISLSASTLQAKDKLLVVTTFSILQDIAQQVEIGRASCRERV